MNFKQKTTLALAALALTASNLVAAQTTLLNVSYDVAREFYKDINTAFIANYKKTTGKDIKIDQSHAGSSAQARAVNDGLDADVVTMKRGHRLSGTILSLEGEVLTLAVDPMRRREGIGADLLNAAMTRAAESGVARMFLEVSVENTTAIGLYRRMGFETVGGRRRYYADGTDALVMRADLHPG